MNSNVFFRAGATVSYTVRVVEFMNRPGLGFGSGSVETTTDPLSFLSRGAGISSLGGG